MRVVAGREHDAVESAQSVQDDLGWIDLLYSGLSFRLTGLAPYLAVEKPRHRDAYDIGSISGDIETVRLCVGDHLKGAQGTLPVFRGMLALARDLVRHFEGVHAVAWPPANSLIGRRYFESTVTAWLEGGAFPALGLASFVQADDGSLESVGLAYLVDQEMSIAPVLASDPVTATRLGVRIANHLVLAGGISEREEFTGPDGASLVMEPSDGGRIVRIKRE